MIKLYTVKFLLDQTLFYWVYLAEKKMRKRMHSIKSHTSAREPCSQTCGDEICVMLLILHGMDLCTLLTFCVRRSGEKAQHYHQENPAFVSYQLTWVLLLKLTNYIFQHYIHLSSELCVPRAKL